MPNTQLLSPYRVLDLTDQRGEVVGMFLHDLGAEVIRVEPPGGGVSRRCASRSVIANAPEATASSASSAPVTR